MGWNPFKKIKKAIKKVASGIKKVVKKTVKGIKKVVKKISSSKILKALAIAAAVVVTGGAAIGAFGGTAASSTFGSWMVGASNAITGFTVAGIPVGAVMKPFQYVGAAIGSTAGKLTDLTGITTEAGRLGTTNTGLTQAQVLAGETPSSVAVSASKETTAQQLARTSEAAFQSGSAVGTSTGIMNPPLSTQTFTSAGGTLNIPTTLPAGTSIGTSSGVVGTQITGGAAAQLSQTVPAAFESLGTSIPIKNPSSWAARNPKTASFLGTVGTGVATSVATGYAMQQLAGDPEETGSMAGLKTEGASSFDPLRVYAAERDIADADISKYFTFGNTPETGNMPLFQQQTIGVE